LYYFIYILSLHKIWPKGKTLVGQKANLNFATSGKPRPAGVARGGRFSLKGWEKVAGGQDAQGMQA
jgi:hypothetical protein